MTKKIIRSILVKIKLNEMNEQQQEAFWRAEQELINAGVFFDTGFSIKGGFREWLFEEGKRNFLEVSMEQD